jgi:hypothetical protein
MAQTDPARDGDRRLLDVFLQMQHYDKWKADLDLLPSTGVNCIRYSVPWYRAEPKPGVYDWSWIDKPVEYLVNTLKIIPIMDLMHYGTPVWMPAGVADERFPEAIAKYAAAMATHFKGLVNHYSPQNEPQLTCTFCGLSGRWPPYTKTPEGWTKVGLAVAKAMVLEMAAIRAAVPDAVIVSVDLWRDGIVDRYIETPKDDPHWQEVSLAAASYPASLVYGKVSPNHPFAAFLEKFGATSREISWFEKHTGKPDILGYNLYPDFLNGWGERPDLRTNDYTKHGTIPLAKAARDATALITPGIIKAQRYFDLAVYLTETSAGLSTEARVAYIQALGDWANEICRQGLPLRGINWWPLFDTIQWSFREQASLPLQDFIFEGGWNNGLYRIQVGADGDLKRVPTSAAKAFHDLVANRS